jgi:hypothetical protein
MAVERCVEWWVVGPELAYDGFEFLGLSKIFF